MLSYLAMPIDRSTTKNPVEKWDEVARLMLKSLPSKAVVFAPGLAFLVGGTYGHETAAGIAAIDSMALSVSDVALFVVESLDVPSWGVPMEVLTAAQEDKPMALVTPYEYEELPTYLKAFFPPEQVFKDLTKACAYLTQEWVCQ